MNSITRFFSFGPVSEKFQGALTVLERRPLRPAFVEIPLRARNRPVLQFSGKLAAKVLGFLARKLRKPHRVTRFEYTVRRSKTSVFRKTSPHLTVEGTLRWLWQWFLFILLQPAHPLLNHSFHPDLVYASYFRIDDDIWEIEYEAGYRRMRDVFPDSHPKGTAVLGFWSLNEDLKDLVRKFNAIVPMDLEYRVQWIVLPPSRTYFTEEHVKASFAWKYVPEGVPE